MLANAKTVCASNKQDTRSPDKCKKYRNGWKKGKKTEMGKIRVLGETLQGVFTARSKADSQSRPCEELSQRAS